MSARTLLLLSGVSAARNRGRGALLASTVAMSGALVIAAFRLLRLPGLAGLSSSDYTTVPGLSSYVGEAGLRPGVVLGIFLLTVPLLALGVQAIRIGEAERRRRLEVLSIVGATPRQSGTLSAIDAMAPALLGAVAAGPAYLLLWLALGVAPSPDHRLLPTPDAGDLVTWGALVVIATLAAGIAAATVHARPATARIGRTRLAVAAVALVALITLVLSDSSADVRERYLATAVALLLMTVLALSLGRVLVVISARLWRRRPGGVAVLATGRVLADPLVPGRGAAVLLLCGLAVGVSVPMATLMPDASDPQFVRQGAALAVAATCCAVTVALVSLYAAAAEHLAGTLRLQAGLHALGIDRPTARRVQWQALSVSATPAAGLGALIGSIFSIVLTRAGVLPCAIAVVVVTAATACALHLLSGLAVLVLDRRLARASDPQNLRAA